MHGDAQEKVVRQLAAVTEQGDVTLGVQTLHHDPAVEADPALVERLQDRGGRLRRRRDRHPQRQDEVDRGALDQPSALEELVHEKRRLAGRGRALERRPGDADHHAASLEPRDHVREGEGPGHGVELVAVLDQPGCQLGVQVGAQSHDEDVGVERPCRGGGAPRDGVDGRDCRLDHAHAGLHDVDVPVDDVRGGHPTEHDVELGEAEDEAVGLVDQHDVDVVAELLRQTGRHLEAAEPGAQDQNSHGGRLGTDGGLVRDFGATRQARPEVIASSRSRTRGSW